MFYNILGKVMKYHIELFEHNYIDNETLGVHVCVYTGAHTFVLSKLYFCFKQNVLIHL